MSQQILFRRLAFYKLILFYSPQFFTHKTQFIVCYIIKKPSFYFHRACDNSNALCRPRKKYSAQNPAIISPKKPILYLTFLRNEFCALLTIPASKRQTVKNTFSPSNFILTQTKKQKRNFPRKRRTRYASLSIFKRMRHLLGDDDR